MFIVADLVSLTQTNEQVISLSKLIVHTLYFNENNLLLSSRPDRSIICYLRKPICALCFVICRFDFGVLTFYFRILSFLLCVLCTMLFILNGAIHEVETRYRRKDGRKTKL